MTLETPNSILTIPIGSKVLVSGTSDYLDRDYWRAPGQPAIVLALRQSAYDGNYLYLLLDKEHPDAKYFNDYSSEGRAAMLKAQGHKYDHLLNVRRWISTARAGTLRIERDPTYLSPEAATGIHVCGCGFINKDISVSAIINGKYMCRQCRLIWKK